MARVPTNGSINMFDSTDSIYEVVKAEFGTPPALTFSAIISHIKIHCTIDNFHPSFRPALLNDVNESRHFRGFPITDNITWYMDNRVENFEPV